MSIPPPGGRDHSQGDAAKAGEDDGHDVSQGGNPSGGEPVAVGKNISREMKIISR